jgi:hypothetical protein
MRAVERDNNRKRLVLIVWLVGALAFLPDVVFDVAHTDGGVAIASVLASSLGLLTIGIVAVVLCRQVPDNPIGWLYLAAWTYATITQAIAEYASWTEGHQPDAPLSSASTWVANWSWVPLLSLLVLFPLLLYPDGHLPSPRWRRTGQAAVAVTVLWTVSFAFEGSDYASVSGTDQAPGNPMTPDALEPFFNMSKFVLAFVFIGLVLAAVVSLFLRYKRGNDTVRAQLKWFAFAGTTWIVILVLPADHGNGGWVDVLMGLALPLMQIAICIAITRHGLYEIDRIISRTLAYAVVTGAVIATYALVVTTITRLLPLSSTLAVTIATLVAAALFQPLLHLVRGTIDRRFNRASYSAQLTIDRFGARLRHEIDSQTLSKDLLDVVGSTVEPKRLHLWLRTPA